MRSLVLLSLFGLFASACAHTPNLALRPETPAPEGQEVGSFKAADGTELWRRKWIPDGAAEGRADHPARASRSLR